MSRDEHTAVSLQFLFVAAFLVQMTVGVLGITVPIYADSLGASPFLLGIIGGAGGLIYSFMPLVSGMLSDKFSRKAFISASMASYTLASLLYILSEEPFRLIFIKILEWLSIAAFWPALEALIADSSEEKLEEALKKFNIAWGSAMVIGPTIGGALISGYSVKAPFFLSLVITLLLGLLSLVLVKEPPRETEKTARRSQMSNNLSSQYSILNALSSIFLFSSLIGIVTSLFPAYATKLGIPAYEVGLMMFMFGAARTVTFYQAYRIEAKLRKIGMFLGGSLTLAVASFLVASSYTT
ncbi:MAG: MFS transporter, partial [Candidatus Bathyarchaeia archaeon]